mmetsp:Transcript_13453/g.27457  ORF Transcript_13453/g.27457 Transcript_13453/m.27457 type:complete len:554 (-) Transcript_13453:1385-3046(-)
MEEEMAFEHPLQKHPLSAMGERGGMVDKEDPGDEGKEWGDNDLDGDELRFMSPGENDGWRKILASGPQRNDPGLRSGISSISFEGDDQVERRHRGAADLVWEETHSTGFLLAEEPNGEELGGLPDPLAVTTDNLDLNRQLEESFGLYEEPDIGDHSFRKSEYRRDRRQDRSELLRDDVVVSFLEEDERQSAGTFVVTSRLTMLRGLDGGDTKMETFKTIRRSIADFVWLYKRLRFRFEGLIVPPLPPMNATGRFLYGFGYVEARRRGLEKFLRRIVTHEELAGADEVLGFLGVLGDDLWVDMRLQAVDAPIQEEATHPSILQLSSWVGHMMWLTGRQINTGLGHVLERRQDLPTEDHLQRLRRYVKELQRSLSCLKEAEETHSFKQSAHARSKAHLQDCYRLLGRIEHGKFEEFLERYSSCIQLEGERMSALSLRHSKMPEGHLYEMLSDFLQRSKAGSELMDQRIRDQEMYEHKLEIYRKLRDRLASRGGEEEDTTSETPMPPPRRLGTAKLEGLLLEAAKDLEATRGHYERVAISTVRRMLFSILDVADNL